MSYYIARRDGMDMTSAEAFEALSRVSIRHMEPLNQQIRQYLNLAGESFLVQFNEYRTAREVVSHFSRNDIYTVQVFNDGGKSRPQHRYRDPRSPEQDSRTIWISNLHHGVTQAEVYDLLVDYGDIRNIIVKNVSFRGRGRPSQSDTPPRGKSLTFCKTMS